jgi:hypothetical protein
VRRPQSVVRCLIVVAGVLALQAPARLQTTVLESFDGPVAGWVVTRDVSGGGVAEQTTAPVDAGSGAARLAVGNGNGVAQIRVAFSDPATAHVWEERPGTHRWQRARVFVPSAAITALGASGSLTLGGFWASGSPSHGWFLRVRAGGQLSAVGTRFDSAPVEFPVYATLPLDRWFTLELGLHSQHGPGVKRAFAFFIDGVGHGWYRQGRMATEIYDRAAVGILATTNASPLELFVDEWGTAGLTALPTGPDLRSTAPLQTKDFRSGNGAAWQIDWSTWTNDLRLDPAAGLYANSDRVQAGMNLDRAPSLADGWGEIEIDWPNGRPIDVRPNGYFGPMIGFRKEINREQNLEVIPRGNGNGTVDLLLEAWDGSGPTVLASWPLPVASFGGSSIPEPGDIIRARWAQSTPSALEIRASYFDASAGQWFEDVIAGVYDLAAVNGVNFNDGFHTASSITIDSPYYSIRRFHAGTPATYPGTPVCTFATDPASLALPFGGGSGAIAVTAGPTCAWTASASPWITLTGATSGNGDGSVAWTVAANDSAFERTGQVTIADRTVAVVQAGNPAAPSALAVSDAMVTEGSSGAPVASFAVTLSPASTNPVSVTFATAPQTAATGVDFVAASGVLAFAPGETTKLVTVSIVPDLLDEAAETFDLSLSAPSGAAIADGLGVGTIVDDDPLPTLSISDAGATEGTATAGVATFTVTLSAASGLPVQVGYATVAGTATAGSDFVASTGTLSFPPGTTTLPVAVALVADAINEPTETFQVTLSAPVNAGLADGSGAGTIADDDTPTGPTTATFAIAAGADDVNDDGAAFAPGGTTMFVGNGGGASFAGLRFTNLAIPRGATVTSARVQLRASATQWNSIAFEWAAEASGNAAPFAAASRPSQRTLGTPRVAHTSNVQWVSGTFYTLEELAPLVQAVVDRADWTSGNALALIARGTGGAWGRKFASAFESGAANAARLVVSYTTPGGPPPPSLSVNDVTVAEGTGTNTVATFTVSLSGASTQTVTVNYATANGTAAAGADYTATASSLTFAPGVTAQTVTVPVIGDTTVEPSETFTLSLSAPVNATLGDGTGQATITDDDVPAASIVDVMVGESAGTATFTVTLSAPPQQAASFSYGVAGLTATAGQDFTAVSGTVTFAIAQITATVTVPILGDALIEPSETFQVTLSNPANATLADGVAVGTITDDDAPTLSVNDVSVGESAGPAVFTVTLSAAALEAVSVTAATAAALAGPAATAGSDYTAASTTLTFAVGETVKTVSVPVLGDGAVEPAETFRLLLSAPVNAGLADGVGVGTIVDDDMPAISVNDVTQAEGTGAATSAVFTVTLSAAYTQTVTVGYATAGGSATSGVDFTAASGTLSFAPGTTSLTVAVTVAGDSLIEPAESFQLLLSAPTNATLADDAGLATIVDDDVPAITVNDVTQAEGTGAGTSVVFTVTLSAAHLQPVSVSYATAAGTATSGVDFTAAAGTLSFPPGVTTQTVTVLVAADAVVEPNETFTLQLSSPVNATLLDASGLATLTNDDVPAGPTTLTVQVSAAGDDVNQEGTGFNASGATLWVGNGAASAASHAGLRLAALAIPRNATITAARLEVQAASTQWLTIGLEIGLEAAASSAVFSAAAPPSARTLLTPRTPHSSNAQWLANTWYSLGDVTALVQALVNRGDWNLGNAAAFVLRGTGGAFGRKFVRAFEGGAAAAPRLIVSYTVP